MKTNIKKSLDYIKFSKICGDSGIKTDDLYTIYRERATDAMNQEEIWIHLRDNMILPAELPLSEETAIAEGLKALRKRELQNAKILKAKEDAKLKAEEEARFKHKAYFEHDGNLYLEILTSDDHCKYAHLDALDCVAVIDDLGDYRPVELNIKKDGDLDHSIRMPNEGIINVPKMSAGELLLEMQAHVAKYCDMKEDDLEMASYYALFTWFYSKVDTRPYLRFISDTGKGKSRMLSVIGDLCFYPIRATGATSYSAMLRSNESWHGTLVIDEADTRNNQKIQFYLLGMEDEQTILLTNQNDFNKREVFDPRGPKIFSMREQFRDDALEGRLFSIRPYETTKRNIPILKPPEYKNDVQNLQNKIAHFALSHWKELDGADMMDFRDMGIEARLQQLAMPISIIFQMQPDGEETFRAYLKKRQKELKRDRSEGWAGTCFNTGLDLVLDSISSDFASYYNDGDLIALTSAMIAKQMNTSAGAVTKALKSIGFRIEPTEVTLSLETGKKKRTVRKLVVPNEETWNEITQRYYFSEDGKNIEMPEIFKSGHFIHTLKQQTLQESEEDPEENIESRKLEKTEPPKPETGAILRLPPEEVNMGTCEICGERRYVTHSQNGNRICGDCAEKGFKSIKEAAK